MPLPAPFFQDFADLAVLATLSLPVKSVLDAAVLLEHCGVWWIQGGTSQKICMVSKSPLSRAAAPGTVPVGRSAEEQVSIKTLSRT